MRLKTDLRGESVERNGTKSVALSLTLTYTCFGIDEPASRRRCCSSRLRAEALQTYGYQVMAQAFGDDLVAHGPAERRFRRLSFGPDKRGGYLVDAE